MIVLYNKNKTKDFNTNDLILTIPTKCIVSWEENGLFKVALSYPIIEGHEEWQQITKGAIIKVPVPGLQDQLFRLNTPVKKFNGTSHELQVTGYHISYDLSDNFLEDVRPSNMDGAQAGQAILNATQYKHGFTFDSDIQTVSTAYYIRTNPINALIGDEDQSYINRWGGFLQRDNFKISMTKESGKDNGVSIEYSKNLLGFTQSADDEKIMTRCYPIITISSNNDQDIPPVISLPEKYIDSPLINDYAIPYIKEVKVSLTRDQESLSEQAKHNIMRDYVNSLYSVYHIDRPIYSYDISFVNLAETQEYEKLAVLETVNPGDYVTVKCLDVDVNARVTAYTYDSLTKKYNDITLGSVQNNIITSISRSLFNVTKSNESNIKMLQNVISSITGENNAILTGSNNLFDHSTIEQQYLSEWQTTGTVLNAQDSDINIKTNVLTLQPVSTAKKADVVLNPNLYNGQDVTLSVKAKYTDVTLATDGYKASSSVKLGALDIGYSRTIADEKTAFYLKAGSTTTLLSQDLIYTIPSTAFSIDNPEGYTLSFYTYTRDQQYIETILSSAGVFPANCYFVRIELVGAGSNPLFIKPFRVYETQDRVLNDVCEIQALSPNEPQWTTLSAKTVLTTGNTQDIIKSIDFVVDNADTTATASVAAFMLSTGVNESDYVSSDNDKIEKIIAQQVITDSLIADTARINTLLAGNLTADNISTDGLTADIIKGGLLSMGGSTGGVIEVRDQYGDVLIHMSQSGFEIRKNYGGTIYEKIFYANAAGDLQIAGDITLNGNNKKITVKDDLGTLIGSIGFEDVSSSEPSLQGALCVEAEEYVDIRAGYSTSAKAMTTVTVGNENMLTAATLYPSGSKGIFLGNIIKNIGIFIDLTTETAKPIRIISKSFVEADMQVTGNFIAKNQFTSDKDAFLTGNVWIGGGTKTIVFNKTANTIVGNNVLTNVTVTPQNSFSHDNTYCKYNPITRQVHLHVQCNKNSPGSSAVAIATLPAGFRPLATVKLLTMNAANFAGKEMQIWTDGQIVLWNPNGEVMYLYFDAFYYV